MHSSTIFQSHYTAASVVWTSEFLAANSEVPGSILALLDLLSGSGSGTGSTQPREDK
jgi:hypothetical protein